MQVAELRANSRGGRLLGPRVDPLLQLNVTSVITSLNLSGTGFSQM